MKLLVHLFFVTIFGHAQPTVTGKWKTVDDNSGKIKSIVEIFERKGMLFGKIVRLIDPAEPDPICNQCPTDDVRYGKKIIGMEIIKGMKKDGDEYKDGDILDPEAGKIYRCKLWIEDGHLKVRGYWGPFYRTQTWMKLTGS
jgi:uncharacterized protein (DUF2147 family)